MMIKVGAESPVTGVPDSVLGWLTRTAVGVAVSRIVGVGSFGVLVGALVGEIKADGEEEKARPTLPVRTENWRVTVWF